MNLKTSCNSLTSNTSKYYHHVYNLVSNLYIVKTWLENVVLYPLWKIPWPLVKKNILTLSPALYLCILCLMPYYSEARGSSLCCYSYCSGIPSFSDIFTVLLTLELQHDTITSASSVYLLCLVCS